MPRSLQPIVVDRRPRIVGLPKILDGRKASKLTVGLSRRSPNHAKVLARRRKRPGKRSLYRLVRGTFAPWENDELRR